jgi:hypothetical protein
MDPYLEGSEWVSMHVELSSEIARQLAPQLRPKYVVRMTRQCMTEVLDDRAITAADIYPDKRVPQVSIEIRDVAHRDLVTAIEVLSPTNKRGEGYQEYLDKRGRVLLSPAHLIEIDLLRSGRRVPMQEPLPPAPYLVFVSRAERRPLVEVWPIYLQNRLPAISVPLLAGDADMTCDLQLALTTVYDTLSYDLSIDYTRPPEVPLDGPDAEWAATVLCDAGIVS